MYVKKNENQEDKVFLVFYVACYASKHWFHIFNLNQKLFLTEQDFLNMKNKTSSQKQLSEANIHLL